PSDWGQLSRKVCPFADTVDNEDSIAMKDYAFIDGIHHRSETGYYLQCFAGHVNDEPSRLASSSGGLITWLAQQFLSAGKVDAVACVSKTNDPKNLFQYKLVRELDDLRVCKKSRYYPVEVSTVIQDIKHFDGRVLFIGLPCFIKSLKLAVKVDPVLNERVAYTIGLFCGHLKSKHYLSYLARSCGVNEKDVVSADFRRKVQGMPAHQYAFEVCGETQGRRWSRNIMMHDVFAGSWGLNLFMLDACDFCDDVLAETADVAVGDAWLPEFTGDYRGENLLVCRHPEFMEVLQNGRENNRIALLPIPAAKVIQSQAGGLRQRREGLSFRLFLSARRGLWRPRKRVEPDGRAGGICFRLLQRLRAKTKSISKEAFLEQQSESGLRRFKRRLRFWILSIQLINVVRHGPGAIGRRIRRILSWLHSWISQTRIAHCHFNLSEDAEHV
ncbi:MAG: Coenzyme F420 hydrogenase/dehydrogenase, beta subunit C-terminal domain, partial [Planctomycetota bacterium]